MRSQHIVGTLPRTIFRIAGRLLYQILSQDHWHLTLAGESLRKGHLNSPNKAVMNNFQRPQTGRECFSFCNPFLSIIGGPS